MVTKDGDGLKLFGMVNEFHKIKQSGQERTRWDKRIIVHLCSDEEAIVSLVSSYPPCPPPLSLVISWNAGISLWPDRVFHDTRRSANMFIRRILRCVEESRKQRRP